MLDRFAVGSRTVRLRSLGPFTLFTEGPFTLLTEGSLTLFAE